MKKILILGGNSDIGIQLLKKLINTNNFEIHLHYNKKFSIKKFEKKIKLIKIDLGTINSKNLKKKFDSNYDIIINLVGYISNQTFLDFDIKELQKTLKINSIIPLMIIRNSLNNMIKKNFGRIINTSSVGVKFGGGGNTFSYSLSKHINEFIPGYIRKLCSKNILYNTLRIGLTDTKLHNKIKNKSLKQRIKLIPMKKIATTDDIAEYMFYLIVHNNFIANELINITGGE
jgi:3-oxoacyl-[acyl-carrier protein] reductase